MKVQIGMRMKVWHFGPICLKADFEMVATVSMVTMPSETIQFLKVVDPNFPKAVTSQISRIA